jgi:hypothetical protein
LFKIQKNETLLEEKDLVFRGIILFIGFGIAVSGGTTAILYLNLIPIGYNYLDYIQFISQRFECYLFPVGIIIAWLSIYFPGNQITN